MSAASNEHETLLGPPQFRLRTLMLAITICGVLFALMSSLGALWSLALVLFASLIGAHVAGNAIGTRLREQADEHTPVRPVDRQAHIVSPVPGAKRLRERTGISRLMIGMAAVGATLGGTTGGLALSATLGERTSASGLGLGTFSSAVLGGFFGFLLASFFSVAGRALGEALREPEPPFDSSSPS